MKENGKDSPRKAFCTFCIAPVEASRIRGHLRRCTDRRLDIDAAGVRGEDIRSFLLWLRIAGFPEAWVVLEVHDTLFFGDVEAFIHALWFPEIRQAGVVTAACQRWRKLLDAAGGYLDKYPVGEIFREKDRFRFSVVPGNAAAAVEAEVIAYGSAAVRHVPIDIVAYPVGSDRGTKPVAELCPWLLRAQ